LRPELARSSPIGYGGSPRGAPRRPCTRPVRSSPAGHGGSPRGARSPPTLPAPSLLVPPLLPRRWPPLRPSRRPPPCPRLRRSRPPWSSAPPATSSRAGHRGDVYAAAQFSCN
jgi:hypothetical protein